MRDYLFQIIEGEGEGEQFFVECDSLAEAWRILTEENDFDESVLEYVCEYSPAIAEAMGLDTY